MANTPQTRKRIKQSEKHRKHNMALRSVYRTYIKKVLIAIESNNKEEAQSAFIKATSIIDRVTNKGIMHKNKAARHKSRLSKRIKGIQ